MATDNTTTVSTASRHKTLIRLSLWELLVRVWSPTNVPSNILTKGGSQSGRSVKLTTRLHLVASLRECAFTLTLPS